MFQRLTFLMVVFDLVAFPLKNTVFELYISGLEVLVVLVDSFVLFLLVTEEVVDSLHTRFRVHVGNHSHHQQTHRGGNEVENGQHCVNFC